MANKATTLKSKSKLESESTSKPSPKSGAAEKDLARHYHEIGITAVAAAARYQGRQTNADDAPASSRSRARLVVATD
jgi:hypothetical protein